MTQTNEISQFLDFLADAILIIDEHSNIVFVNNSCTKLFGYQREHFLTLTIDDLMKPDMVSNHGEKVSGFIRNQSQAREMMSRNIMPCIDAEGELFGARISIASIIFNDKPCGIATIQDYSTVQNLIKGLSKEASTDALTGLYNRRYLDQLLESDYFEQPNRGDIGIAFLDLNGFKAINDTFGHEVGDELLTVISRRLINRLRPDDLCFRMGGDEFLVVFRINKPSKDHAEAKQISRKIHELVTSPILIKKIEQEVTVGVSIGTGILDHDQVDLMSIVEKADLAMYQAKKKKQTYAFVK
jgi:diguanylate cyclase (GGDEF)-like protein/PAS domain S-box-containing protein